MVTRLGDEAPDFVADTTRGTLRFHDWKRGRWAMLFSHPADFTPVCTTELASIARLQEAFEKRGVAVLGLSVDPLDFHFRWLKDVEDVGGVAVRFPVIADPNRWVASLYGMVHPNAEDPDAVRSAIVIDPENRVRMTLAYPDATGRSFGELLRVIDSLQLNSACGCSTPADWRPGEDVIVPAEMSDAEAARRFPGFATKTPYLRTTPQPER